MDTWAEKIASLQAAGWSLSAIAEAIDLSPQALSDIKQGRTTEPRGMAAVRLHHMFLSRQLPPASVGKQHAAQPEAHSDAA